METIQTEGRRDCPRTSRSDPARLSRRSGDDGRAVRGPGLRRELPAAPPERPMMRQIVALLAASLVFWPMRWASASYCGLPIALANGRIATVGGPERPPASATQ
jgi:hypothetical protein